jgi:hypothetical protein
MTLALIGVIAHNLFHKICEEESSWSEEHFAADMAGAGAG